MAGGGGSSVQSAPQYISDWHSYGLDGGPADHFMAVSMSEYMNSYLDTSLESGQTAAKANPFAVQNQFGSMWMTRPYPDIRTNDTDDYKEYMDYFRKGDVNSLEQYVIAHINSLEALMNTEAADVMEVATRWVDQLLVDFPELGTNVVASLEGITNELLGALYAYMNDPAFTAILDTYNQRVEDDRDQQVGDFKNQMGMQDASLSSAFNVGLGQIYEETLRKEGEYAAQVQLDLFTKGFAQFLQAYLADYTWIKQMKNVTSMQLSQFVMGTFAAKNDKNATQLAMYDSYIKLAMSGIHDIFSYVQATRTGFYQWPFEVFQMGANFMSAGMGGNIPIQKASKAQSAFSGAAAGAGIGTAIAPGIGTAIGAGVGLLGGLLGG